MQTSKEHIAQQLRQCLPPDKKEATWGYLAAQFPWYAMVHWLRAAEQPKDETLLQKAALFSPDILRLHGWLHANLNAETLGMPEEPISETPEELFAPVEPFSENTIEATEANVVEKTTPVPPVMNPPVSRESELDGNDSEDRESISPSTHPEEITLALPGLDKLIEKSDNLANELSLEPYHSVDYFASQGIKADKKLPEKEETQFDKQVKSFTDWLKTMKRLKYQPAADFSDPLVEAKAKKSLDHKEVVTEAMAEVWAKQGNFSEAARVYARLMLLHPEKTPYFAARLQEINQKQ